MSYDPLSYDNFGVPYSHRAELPGFDHVCEFARYSPANRTPLIEIGAWLAENDVACCYLRGGMRPLRVAFRTVEAATAFKLRWG